ncbi:hypothetical protein VMCG_08100 [Cytospora schulzeri]|uniref:Uncharacterized protein n=1 Tax=Cytospora schulzeri TaxID=448051 RepID=A0A423VRP2_9PEZI|nr:hypothetical protein VMCG_08100 [Valsa malicola]
MEYSHQQYPDQHQDGQPGRDQHHARLPSDQSDETIVNFVNYNNTSYPAMQSDYYGQNDGRKAVETTEEVAMVGEVPSFSQSPPPQPLETQTTFAPTEKSQVESNSARVLSFPKFANVKNINWNKTGTWTFEIVSLLFAIAAVASIIAILAYFDNKPLPSWPYKITLNALIAVLTTLANSAMAVPLSSGIGQLKWERFKTGYAPLTDMEVLDEASRGAIAVIVALFLSPFAQQIATYRTLSKESDIGATNFRAMNFTAALPGLDASTPFVPILSTKAAVYNGLFMENNRPWTSLPVNCQTGNCTWEPFDTLAVCNTCVDMTPYMVKSCANTTNDDCGWKTMDGKAMLNMNEVFSMTSQFESQDGGDPWSTIMKLTFMGTESSTSVAGNVEPWARQCTLSACVQTITSQIVNGNLVENVTHIVTNDTVATNSGKGIVLEPVIITSDASTSSNATSSPTSYLLSAEAMLGMQSWFSQLFASGSASRSDSAFNKTIGVNLTVGISSGSTFFDTDIVQGFYWNYYQYPTGLDMLMEDLSVSLTVAFRSMVGQEPVNGIALTATSFVHVRWGFVTPLILAIVLTAGFLSTAMYRNRRCGAQLWKSSTLAVLFHGLEEDVREGFEDLRDFRMQKTTAQGVRDDEVSVGSYHSDAYTLPCHNMDDDGRSIMSVSSYESYDSFCPRERLPSYRVPKEQGASQPVYEAWTLCMSHETGHEVTKLTACGFSILSTHDEEAPWVYYKAEPCEQQELSDMTLAAVGRYQAANKRCLPSRLIRGVAKPYEHDLDQRIQKLPIAIQSELNSLLRHREEATSNRFHRRDWTVAMMREQYRYRFASAKPEEVKRSTGLWKKKEQRRTEYFFVIRGADGKVATDDRGMHQPRENGNPWKKVDEYERWERERAKDMRRFGKEYVQRGWYPRPRGRSLSPGYLPSPPPLQPAFDDVPPPPRRVRVERGRSRSRSRSRSRDPSFSPMPNERFPTLNPFAPGHPAGGIIPPPSGLSNLTTPTTFSRATTNHTGSTMQELQTDTPAETGMKVDVREDSRPASPGTPDPDDETESCAWIDSLADKGCS